MGAHWKGIVGKCFAPDVFDRYVRGLLFDTWKPRFCVLHNTSAPTLAQWGSTPGSVRMANLQDYYRGQGWSAGPHLFVAPEGIWVFTPLTTPGVHSPSWNAISWGVEMVGEYEEESFVSGLGAQVAQNAVRALATLHDVGKIDSSTLRFHKEDPQTDHKSCPGKNVDKKNMVARVHSQILIMKNHQKTTER